MIAYLGKDRQDAVLAGIIEPDYQFKTELIGTENAKIINNLTVDIIEHSYGKDYIMLSDKAFKDLSTAKKENYEVIYNNDVSTSDEQKEFDITRDDVRNINVNEIGKSFDINNFKLDDFIKI